MNRDQLKNDAIVSFRMDGNWDGEGQIVYIEDEEQAVAVKLTKNCKEFETGQIIFVFFNEITGLVDLDSNLS